MVLCIALAALLGAQTGVFVIFPVLVIAFLMHDESPKAGFLLVAGSALGTVISFGTIDLFLTARPLFMLATLIVTCILGYWAAQGFRGRWPGAFAAFFANLIVVGAAFAAIGGAKLGEQVAFYWTLEIVLGLAVTWLVMLCLWPAPSTRDLDNLCSGIAQECAVLLDRTADRLTAGQVISYHPSPVSLMNFGKWRHQVDCLKWRYRGEQQQYDAVRQRMRNLMLAYVNVRHMERTLQDMPQGDEVAKVCAAMNSVLRGLAQGMKDPAGLGGLDAPLRVIDRHRIIAAENLQEPDIELRRLPSKLAAFTTAVRELQENLMALADPEMSEVPIPVEPSPAGQTAWIAQDSAKAALKLTLGVAVALLLHLSSFVPAGAYLVLGLVVVMVQPNLGKSHLRVRLWFPGVLAGSAYSLLGLGLISVAPHFPLLLAWLATGFLIGAYIGAGHDRISYSGFQICIGIAVILGTAAFPVATVVPAEERVLGAVLGFVVALVIGQNLWPEHPADMLRKNVADNLRALTPALQRISSAKDPDPAMLNAHLLRLQTDVQTDFALLYDFSYMLRGKIRAKYDYGGMTHATGNMFHQMWTLHQALQRIKDPEISRAMIAPTTGALEQVGLLVEALADELSAGRALEDGTIRARLAALDVAIEEVKSMPIKAGESQRAWLFGVNFIREMRHQLALVVTSIEAENTPILPDTSKLALTYEGIG
ncbi:FUSC family protein [Ruegeria sp. 2012CJ41-6]|uniref:FUSC family protein n=1 Tax=Ruegeria spongiae TaxID=2942209 RepID=A0ABT0Q6T8_9RHOB|nr:FUSC family protein [Ruegeria spongiae]